MANETRTMMVVLVVCGFLLLGCIGIPVGVGALMFLRLSQDAQAAKAQTVRAVVAERQARDQAEIARMQAESLTTAQAGPSIPAPPTVPNLTSPLAIPSGLLGFDITDVEQRKTVYRAMKTVREFTQQFEQGLAQLAVGADEANLKQAVAEMKKAEDAQLEQVCKAYGITRKQLDEIIAEGDKAGW